jgi:hypothetical protein
VSYISVTVPDPPKLKARPTSRWGWFAELGSESQSHSSRIASPPKAETTEGWSTHGSRAIDPGMEPVMEVWIDDRTSPVTIRLMGLLDSSTSPSLLALFNELLGNGAKDFLLDAGGLEIGDGWGATALTVLQRRARGAGGSLRWEGVDFGQSAVSGEK